MSLTNLYVLKLEGENFYVGKSDNPTKRYQEHLNGSGSAWTKKYPPVSVLEIRANSDPFDEDKVTKQYMKKYGIDKVRGGSYSNIKLDETQIKLLNKELRTADDSCLGCGLQGHFINNCRKTIVKAKVDSEVVWGCNYCDRTFETAFGCGVHEKSCKRDNKVVSSKKKGVCYRCGRTGHYSPDCYARTDTDGNELSDDDSDDSY